MIKTLVLILLFFVVWLAKQNARKRRAQTYLQMHGLLQQNECVQHSLNVSYRVHICLQNTRPSSTVQKYSLQQSDLQVKNPWQKNAWLSITPTHISDGTTYFTHPFRNPVAAWCDHRRRALLVADENRLYQISVNHIRLLFSVDSTLVACSIDPRPPYYYMVADRRARIHLWNECAEKCGEEQLPCDYRIHALYAKKRKSCIQFSRSHRMYSAASVWRAHITYRHLPSTIDCAPSAPSRSHRTRSKHRDVSAECAANRTSASLSNGGSRRQYVPPTFVN
jgi:hypothetical protein